MFCHKLLDHDHACFAPALPEKRMLKAYWSVLELEWLRKKKFEALEIEMV